MKASDNLMVYNINDILDVLSESTAECLYDMCDLFTEGEKMDKFKDVVKKAEATTSKIIDKTTNSKVGKVMGKAYNAVSETPGAIASKIAYKKPAADASPEVQKEYNKKVISMKANFKVGVTLAVLAIKLPLFGPIDWVITACMASGLADKENAVNKETMKKLEVLKEKAVTVKDKIKTLFAKNKDKDSTDKEFQQEYNKLLRDGNEIAKAADVIIKGNMNKKAVVAENAFIDKFDKYLITENSVLVDNAFDILQLIVEKTDYSKIDIYPVLEHYFEMAY